MNLDYPHECMGAELLRMFGEHLSASEAIVTKAMDPLWRQRAAEVLGQESFDAEYRSVKNNASLATVLRTGAYFIFGEEDVSGEAVEVVIGEAQRTLPPTPFARMWLELHDPYNRLSVITDIDGHRVRPLGFAVIEEKPCEDWLVLMPMLDATAVQQAVDRGEEIELGTGLAVRRWHLIAHEGGVAFEIAEREQADFDALDDEWQRWWRALWGGLPEFLVQLIHLSGATLAPRSIPRQARRDFQRRYGHPHPNIYWVRLGAVAEGHPGAGEREFFHRWLVRGHYRRDARGGYDVPGKGTCVWVRPYVKGPDGAPWMGRPVHATSAVLE